MKKTDNSLIDEKVKLRLEVLELINKNEINVLECYSGKGLVWNNVKIKTNKIINILKIDQKRISESGVLIGDNRKYLKCLDLSKFDIIDLDAYGIPFNQLEIIFKKNYEGYVICTMIQTGMGCINNELITITTGFDQKIISLCQVFLSRFALQLLCKYLYINDVQNITGYFIERKRYFYFKKERSQKCQ